MNAISLSGLRIILEDLGTEFLVTGVRPYYAYTGDGQRTDKVEGYKYGTVLPAKALPRSILKSPALSAWMCLTVGIFPCVMMALKQSCITTTTTVCSCRSRRRMCTG